MSKKTRKRGRPAHKPTLVRRRRVALLRAGNMTVEQIASVMDLDEDTLRKYYSAELVQGALKKRADVIESMFKEARRGNVSAMGKFLALSPELALLFPDTGAKKKPQKVATKQQGESAAGAVPPAEGATEDSKGKGKKEQQQEAALEAERNPEWAELLQPTARPQ